MNAIDVRSSCKTPVATSATLPYLRKTAEIRRFLGGTGLSRPQLRRFCNCLVNNVRFGMENMHQHCFVREMVSLND